MNHISLRHFIQAAAATPLVATLSSPLAFAQGKLLTIAYNVALPSWGPTVGSSAVNPTIHSIYKSVFDSYIDQNPDLTFQPGIITKRGWNADKTKVELVLRENAFLARRISAVAAPFWHSDYDGNCALGAAISRLVKIWMSVPPVLLSIVLAAVIGPG